MKFIQMILSSLNKEIVMYSDSMWLDCQEAKSFFAENEIDVRIKDIADEDIKKEMKEKFNRVMVPVIVINGKVFIGFNDNKNEIEKLVQK